MISSTLGALFGGTTRGGHQVWESLALCLITPPNLGTGGGSWVPGIVVVALGAPSVPVTCWARAGPLPIMVATRIATALVAMRPDVDVCFIFPLPRRPSCGRSI